MQENPPPPAFLGKTALIRDELGLSRYIFNRYHRQRVIDALSMTIDEWRRRRLFFRWEIEIIQSTVVEAV